LCIEHVPPPQFGAISSPASHPAEADLMGSLITTLFCMELQLEQSNSRCSNPIGPGLMLVSFIRNVHCGQRGRSIGVSRGIGENCNFDMTLPCNGGSVTDSRSPMVANGGAVIQPRCRNAGLTY
jgi:hypothetical protein